MTDFDISDLERRLGNPFDPVTAMSMVRDLNDLLVGAYVEGNKKVFFRGKYEETISEIEERQLFQDDFNYLAHKAYFYYLNKKTKRLISLVNSKSLHSPELLLLLVELMNESGFPSVDIWFYIEILFKNTTDKEKYVAFLERIFSGKFDFSGYRGQISGVIDSRIRNLYRIETFQNLPSIMERGILSRNKVLALGLAFKNNSYMNIQERRKLSLLNIHDFVPLFFSKYPPMIYSRMVSDNISNELIFVLDPKLISERKPFFSDISLAYMEASMDNLFTDVSSLNRLDFVLFEKKGWHDDSETRKKKGAEILLEGFLEPKYIKEIIYFDKSKETSLKSIIMKSGLSIQTTFEDYANYR